MEWRGAINRISAESMKGHVSFLASDLLEGRGTPSRGQDLATAYIASQFRRFGLKAAGNNGYFQDNAWAVPQPSRASGPLVLGDLKVDPSEFDVFTREDVDVTDAEAVVWTGDKKPDLENKVAVFVVPDSAPEELMGEAMGFLRAANRAKVKRMVIVDAKSIMRSSAGIPRPYKIDSKQSGTTATAFVYSQKVAEAIRAKAGEALTVSFKAPANTTREFPMRNVVAVLPGTDPVLRDTYIVISAHHDHVGMGAGGDDKVFNGANDDASGVADVLEIAESLSKMPVHPKRSVVFVTFAGEEQGLHGSREFANSGLFAPEKIVANFNLEVTGRLDAEQAVAGAATITGMEYSSLAGILERAGSVTGVKVMGEPKNTDAFFSRSDNPTPRLPARSIH